MIFLIQLSFTIGILFFAEPAQAYIDPGSGGYLITSILAAIGGAFAFCSAFIIHFFRHTLVKWIKFLWKKHRVLFVLGVMVFTAGTGYGIYRSFYEPPIPDFDPTISGARIYDRSKISDGYNLFEGKLIDMEGNVVKQWSSLFLGVIDENGDYYAQKYFEAPVWGRYTWDDEVIWEKDFPIHHEILLTSDDTIITFTKEVHSYNERAVEFDVILEFDKGGNVLQRYSLWDHLEEFQKFHDKLELDMPPTFFIPEDHRKDKSIWGGNYDYYHLNALSLVPPNAMESKHPAFRPGNWLISFRHGSMVFILDKDTKKILWRAIYNQVEDNLEGPHSPMMLDNGNILIFDNGRYRKWSRIIELDPVTLDVVWEYKDDNFYTLSQGNAQPLPNGNVLATEAEKGRVIEVTRDKEIVWEFYHPDQQDETNSVDEEKWGLRQEVYRMTRYPKSMIDRIMKEQK